MKQEIFKDYPNPVFIETGSYVGDGIKCAISAGFGRIISIEIAEDMHEHCRNRFKDEIGVELYLGDTPDILPSILKTVNSPCTFWLDAHPSGEEKTGKIKVPVIKELEIIEQHMKETGLKHTILIDDMRNFDKTDGWWGVTKEDITHKINSLGDYNISYADGHVPNDILIAD